MQRQHRFGVGEQLPPGRRQAHAARSAAPKDGSAKPFLQLPDPKGDGGLGDVQAHTRSEKVALAQRQGDRIVVDTARTVPAPGELFVLWDGTGLVVKRVEALTAEGRLRLASAHPDYAAYERPADEVHVVGKVLWKVTRA